MSYAGAYGPSLVIQHTGQVFPLTQVPVTIGRDADNTLILADPEVSGHHAVISWQAGISAYVVEDLGSTNGTYINERRILEPEILRQGDILRVGNTVIDVLLDADQGADTQMVATPAYPPPEDEVEPAPARGSGLPWIVLAILGAVIIACLCVTVILSTQLLGGRDGAPVVTIQSPADGTQVYTASEFPLQASAADADDITLLELSVDGMLVATSTSSLPNGTSSLTVAKPWSFSVPGEHVVSAVAYTASGKTSRTESVTVMAVASGGQPLPSPTPTDVPGQATNTPAPTATITPTPEPGAPQIEYFRASPQSITAGGCTTLEWGQVTGATEARIDPEVGGVGTPGNTTICPAETTTYVLTAKGAGGTTTASTTVIVNAGLADLVIDSITFSPSPAVKGDETIVDIAIRNAGAIPAGAFNWDWAPGQDAYFDGRLGGLNAGDTTVVSVRWRPANAYASLSTVARVDTGNEVPESDEGNNELSVSIQVIDPSGPGSVTLESEAALDGYRGNDGSGSTRQDVLVGNGHIVNPTGELVWRGFLSFDLSSIPAGASVQSSELRFFQAKVGGDPYGKLGNLVLEHLDYGTSLDASDFDLPAMDSAMLAQQPASGAWYVLADRTIAAWVQKDLDAGRTRFQVRLRFAQEKDGDGQEDFAGIESSDNFFGTGNIPLLVVNYER